jgi:hypothetical protein
MCGILPKAAIKSKKRMVPKAFGQKYFKAASNCERLPSLIKEMYTKKFKSSIISKI